MKNEKNSLPTYKTYKDVDIFAAVEYIDTSNRIAFHKISLSAFHFKVQKHTSVHCADVRALRK
jgi:hypothetical protein